MLKNLFIEVKFKTHLLCTVVPTTNYYQLLFYLPSRSTSEMLFVLDFFFYFLTTNSEIFTMLLNFLTNNH